jgi:hypothetical protein
MADATDDALTNPPSDIERLQRVLPNVTRVLTDRMVYEALEGLIQSELSLEDCSASVISTFQIPGCAREMEVELVVRYAEPDDASDGGS